MALEVSEELEFLAAVSTFVLASALHLLHSRVKHTFLHHGHGVERW